MRLSGWGSRLPRLPGRTTLERFGTAPQTYGGAQGGVSPRVGVEKRRAARNGKNEIWSREIEAERKQTRPRGSCPT